MRPSRFPQSIVLLLTRSPPGLALPPIFRHAPLSHSRRSGGLGPRASQSQGSPEHPWLWSKGLTRLPPGAAPQQLLKSGERRSPLQGRSPREAGPIAARARAGGRSCPAHAAVPTLRLVGERADAKQTQSAVQEVLLGLGWVLHHPATTLSAHCWARAAALSCRPACGCTARRTG